MALPGWIFKQIDAGPRDREKTVAKKRFLLQSDRYESVQLLIWQGFFVRDRLLRWIQSPLALLLPIPLWALVMGLVFYHNDRTLLHAGFDLARQRGEVAYQLILTMRHWNAGHGGVYVPLTEETPENPWLEVPEKTITSPEGVVLTKLNPAYMTRQIADMLRGSELEIHLTSHQLVNPYNKPDPWESRALTRLEASGQDSIVEIVDDRFRYMAPLRIDESCMPCHEQWGYQVGDMRGGLSVSFPVSYAERLTENLRRDSILIHFIAFALLSLTGLAALIGLRRLLVSLQQEREERETIIVERTASLKQEICEHRRSQEALSYLAHHDELTGARNRRWILALLKEQCEKSTASPLALLLLDIDHFKYINDNYGHQIGDQVLITFVSRLQADLRRADQLGRYGGEEFLVVLPGASYKEAGLIAERLRKTIANAAFLIEGKSLHVTTSIGVVWVDADDQVTPDEMISRADTALYLAKQTGRNRVVYWNSQMED